MTWDLLHQAMVWRRERDGEVRRRGRDGKVRQHGRDGQGHSTVRTQWRWVGARAARLQVLPHSEGGLGFSFSNVTTYTFSDLGYLLNARARLGLTITSITFGLVWSYPRKPQALSCWTYKSWTEFLLGLGGCRFFVFLSWTCGLTREPHRFSPQSPRVVRGGLS